MQVLSDLLLGWCSMGGRDYLVRQLNDHKSSIEPEELGGSRLGEYSCVCAELLAKGHARSGEPVALSSYLGKSDKAARALLQYAVKYADQAEADFETFKKALKRGLLKAAITEAHKPAAKARRKSSKSSGRRIQQQDAELQLADDSPTSEPGETTAPV